MKQQKLFICLDGPELILIFIIYLPLLGVTLFWIVHSWNQNDVTHNKKCNVIIMEAQIINLFAIRYYISFGEMYFKTFKVIWAINLLIDETIR